MKPLRARYSKIEHLVQDLLRKYDITSPPVPVHDIAKSEGATVDVHKFNKEISGLLLRTGDRAIIAVESTQAPTRQRFTIAHELGHLLLHNGEELRVDTQFKLNLRSPKSSTAEDIEEIEANAFAASLLMPQKFVKKDVADFIIDIDDACKVQALSKRYDVSAQAMTIRLVNLLSLGRI